MKKILPIAILFILFSAVSAHAGKLVLSTYYPAPFGSYDRMKLVPRAALADTYCEDRPSNASMYYTENRASGPDSVRYCLKDESGNQDWVPYPGVWTQNRDDVVSLTDTGLTTFPLKVGIGTTSPDEKFHVVGNIKMVDGNEGAAKVLTSDANGVGTWEEPAGVPPGGIIMWSGLLTAVPTGWALCDGANGTPDLRNRFVYGVNSAEDPGTAGGADSYSLSQAQMPSHTHTGSSSTAGAHAHTLKMYSGEGGIKLGGDESGGARPDGATESAGSHGHTITVGSTGSGASIDNRPAYYKLAFIMKL